MESLNRSAKDFGVDFKTLFEASPGLYLVLLPNDPHFTIVAVSDNYLSATLTKREDIVGRDLFEVFPDNPNDRGANGVENLKASFGKVIKCKTPDVMSKQKYDIPNRDGTGFEERHWRVCNSPVCTSEKDVKYIIHSVMDVTGFLRSKNEVKLQKSRSSREKSNLEFEIFSRELLLEDINQYLQSILDTADHAFVSVDLKGEITSWNKHAEEIFGWTKNEVLGRSLVSTIVPPRFQHAHNQGFQRFIETNESKILGQRLELSALHKKGHEIPVELTVNVLKHRDSLSFFAFLQDITDRKEAEKRIHLLNMRLETKVKERTSELQKALSLADDANRIKSVFLANMSHEIRTPLGAVLGYAELLANPEVNSYERQNFISAIKRNGELLSNIINDILDLSKVEAGKLEIEMGDVLVSELLTDLASLLNLKALSKGIRLSVSCEGSIPKSIRTDALRLRQVLLNIVGNAIKFTERGMVQVLLKMDEKNKLVFEVKDTGCGLSPEHAKKIFQPFYQADPSTKRSLGGAGLGLVLSKHLAKLLGGDVILKESTLRQGSVFEVSVDPGPLEHLSLNSLAEATQKLESAQNSRLDNVRILLAEDCIDNQFLVCAFLTKVGAQVDVVDNGKKAVELAQSKRYDVILMDIQMPVMDGYEATSQLRKAGYKSPIIALTAHALKGEREHCLSLGFDEHNTKPINRNALINSVAKTLAHFKH